MAESAGSGPRGLAPGVWDLNVGFAGRSAPPSGGDFQWGRCGWPLPSLQKASLGGSGVGGQEGAVGAVCCE